MTAENKLTAEKDQTFKKGLSVGMENRILYGLMYAEQIPFIEMTKKLDVRAERLTA